MMKVVLILGGHAIVRVISHFQTQPFCFMDSSWGGEGEV